jgi:streptomycin 6-kinase
MIAIPSVVREKALAVGASAWIDELPLLIREIEADWEITVGRAYTDSTEALVAEATCDDGTRAVLKLLVPRGAEAAARETTVLRLVGGDGCALLLRADVARGALLLERLGRTLYELQVPVRRRHEILVSAASRIWRPAPHAGLPTGAVSPAARGVHREDVGGARPPLQRARGRLRVGVRWASWRSAPRRDRRRRSRRRAPVERPRSR